MTAARALLALLLLGSSWAHAALPPGDYLLVEGHRSFEIEAWGKDCGPRPVTQRHTAGARYRLDDAGWLRAQGAAPPLFQPDICKAATGIPTMRGGRAGSRVRCTNAETAQPVKGQARLLDADPNQLRVLERFEYDWVLKGTRCKLTQHARWTLRRAQPLDRCRSPGPVAKLTRVGAASQRARARQALRFRVLLADAQGCPVTAPAPTWASTVGSIRSDGVLRLGANDAGRSGEVTASVAGQTVRWAVTVRAPRPAAPGRAASSSVDELVPEWDEGEALTGPSDAGLAPQAGSAVSAEIAAGGTGDGDGPSPLVIGVFVGLGLAALGIAGWIGWSARRLRSPGAATDLLEAARVRVTPTTPPPAPAAAPPAPASEPPEDDGVDGPLACPQCGRHFDDGSRFCPFDGGALEEAHDAPGVAAQPKRCPRCGSHWPASASHCAHDGVALVEDDPQDATVAMPAVQAKTCPECGTRYPADTEFCGLDGARLVLLN